MVTPEISALRYTTNEQFSEGDLPDDLRSGGYLEKSQRKHIPCRECDEQMRFTETSGEMIYLCENLHTRDETEGTYFQIRSEDAVTELLSEIDVVGVSRSGKVFLADTSSARSAVVPGPYRDSFLRDLGTYTRENRDLFIITFREGTRAELEKTFGRMGGVSMVVSPPDIVRKFNHFHSIMEARAELESVLDSSKQNIPTELIRKVHDNPQYAIGRLVNFEKIESSPKQRQELEQLCTVVFSQIVQFPLNTLGAEKRGIRVPDGLGFVFNEEHEHSTLLMIDSKSVSSELRDYPNLTESEGPQYRRYLEIANDVCRKEDVRNQVLVFVSPEFNDAKVHDFLDELARTPYDNFKIIFMNLEALSTLLLIKTTLISDADARLNYGRWQSLLDSLFTNPNSEQDKQDYELLEKTGAIMDKNMIIEHFDNSITDRTSKAELLERVQQDFTKFGSEI